MIRRTATYGLVLVVLATIGLAAPATAQDRVLRGRVVHADGVVRLAGADLDLQPSGLRTRSDARGDFEFRGVPAGVVTLTVRRLGFAPRTLVLDVEELGETAITVELTPAPVLLGPLDALGARDPRSLARVGAAVSVVDAEAIGRDRTVGLAETLRMTAGVQAAARQGTSEVNIGIRGSAARTRQAVRGVAILLDGVPLTEPDGVARLDLIDLEATQRVEVVRGPASALYAGAPGGVVNLLSRTGRESPGLVVNLRAGGFGFRKLDARGGAERAGGRSSAFVAGSYTTSDGFRAHTDATIARGQLSVDHLVAPHTRLALEASASTLDSRLPGSLDQEQFDADPDAAAAAAVLFGFGRGDTRYRAGARIEHELAAAVMTGYAFLGGRTLDFKIPTEIVDLDLTRVQSGVRARTEDVAGTRVTATIGIDQDHVGGADRRWLNHQGARGPLHDDGWFAVANLGAYLQGDWQASAAVGLSAGLRYDRASYRFTSVTPGNQAAKSTAFDQLSPRVSATWSPVAAAVLYLSLGRGFEVPAINELSRSPGDPFLSVGPKSLWNLEVGGRRALGGTTHLSGAVFVSAVRGEFVPRTIDGVNLPENASRSRNVGTELALTSQPTRGVQVSASYTFLDLRLRDYTTPIVGGDGVAREVDYSGKRLPGVPRHRATAGVILHPRGTTEFGIEVEHQGTVHVETGNAQSGTWYYTAPGPPGPLIAVPFRAVPPRTLIHLSASMRRGPATVLVSIENLTNRRYPANVIANDGFGQYYEAGAPRTLSVGLRFGPVGVGGH